MKTFPNQRIAILTLARDLLDRGTLVETKNWQSTQVNKPMLECFETVFKVPLEEDNKEAAELTLCDKKWADAHFLERISGTPLNPGESYKIWPYYGKDEIWRKDEVFSHTYMERMWPKLAGQLELIQPQNKRGIRYEYGDLASAVSLLKRDLQTRQCFLPIWFPEDTGVTESQRVPCTLGYLFNWRNGYFHCSYYIRSCDFIRHFQNDIYLTNQLAILILNELRRFFLTQYQLKAGMLFFHCASLHIFEDERFLLERKIKELSK